MQNHKPQNWRKSSHSDSATACVEIATIPGATAIRDSKAPHHGHLAINTHRWHDFLNQLKTSDISPR